MLALLAKKLFDAGICFSGDVSRIRRDAARVSLTRWRWPTESALIVGSREVTVTAALPHQRGTGGGSREIAGPAVGTTWNWGATT
jgi:hypothetical protein